MYLYQLGLVGHIRVHFPGMFRLYEVLHKRSEPPTAEEIEIAAARKTLDDKATNTYLKELEARTENIVRSIAQQKARATVCFYLPIIYCDSL